MNNIAHKTMTNSPRHAKKPFNKSRGLSKGEASDTEPAFETQKTLEPTYRSNSKGRTKSAENLPLLRGTTAIENQPVNFTISNTGLRKKTEFQLTRFTELKLPDKILKGVGKTFSRENQLKRGGEL